MLCDTNLDFTTGVEWWVFE